MTALNFTECIKEYDGPCTDEECFIAECREKNFNPTNENVIMMSVRCAVTIVTAVMFVLVIVVVAKGIRLKSWRLYLITTLILFAWLAMSLYQDHIDQYYVYLLECEAQTR